MSSVYSNPIRELITRLDYHAAAGQEGRLLSGWRWLSAPLANPDGQQDFPSVQMFLPDIQEQYRARHLGEGTLTVKLAVSTLRTEGIAALVDGVALVMDAVETDVNGKVNPGLAGSLTQPLEFSVGNSFVTDLSFTAEVQAVMRPRLFDRGHR